MSDVNSDLLKHYENNVPINDYPRSIGLFPIPEHPEYERRGMWSAALNVIVTTLRYLAPATLITLFWGQNSFLFKILKYIDSAFRALVFSSDEQKEAVLRWLVEVSPVEVDRLDTVWQNGWILCGVLDAALPGACAGHPPTTLSIKHAQTIADHYLGVEPAFNQRELESNDSLSKHQEWKFAAYLQRVRESLSKITPPVQKPTPTRPYDNQGCTLDYVAKGTGLSAAQVNNVMFFKIYPTGQQSLDPKEIHVLIRGPKDTYGMTVVPPLLGKAQLIRQKLLGLQQKPNFTENVLPITHGATYLRNYGKNNMNKVYHIPRSKYDIEIEVELQQHYAKIGYLLNIPGKYEISVTTRGQNILGSPFTIIATKNILSILEHDSFFLEDGEEIDIVDINTDKKVVLRIVDFVTEKMLLNENGSFEKITDEEARFLMATEKSELGTTEKNVNKIMSLKTTTFKDVAKKVVVKNKVVKNLNDLRNKKQKFEKSESRYSANSQLNVPDIVNSTFSDVNFNAFSASMETNTEIVPETLAMSIVHKKSDVTSNNFETNNPFTSTNLNQYYNSIEDELDRNAPLSNIFIDDNETQRYVNEKELGMFVNTEYETNRPQTEETQGNAIKIKKEDSITENNNIFIKPEVVYVERPKTPILKIITGKVDSKKQPLYVDPLTEKLLTNDLLNPFYTQSLNSNESDNIVTSPITDFLIGAPVSLLPTIKIPSPEPTSEYSVAAPGDDTVFSVDIRETVKTPDDEFFTPSHKKYRFAESESMSSDFESFDSSLTGNVGNEGSILCNYVSKILPLVQSYSGSNSPTPSKKDTWDSAYVSIDDSNSSPDNNNNEQSTLFELPLKPEDLSKMGPAELEIWQTSGELSSSSEETRLSKFEIMRPTFTPILEESEKYMTHQPSSQESNNNVEKNEEVDSVTVAFAEINSIYSEYFPNLESVVPIDLNDNDKSQLKDIEYTGEHYNVHVDSASELLSDVKRRALELEGAISEVQSNVTESVSVSQTLRGSHNNFDYGLLKSDPNFKDGNSTNIVLEKKKYWDEKIRQIKIEQECDGTKAFQKKKRLSAKHLRHNDSLTKKRGKQIAKRLLSTDKDTVDLARRSSLQRQLSMDKEKQCENNLVVKWKKYWDEKLETEELGGDTSCFGQKANKNQKIKSSPLPKPTTDVKANVNSCDNDICSVKPKELAEEVFKAFETSPKRFFGTSRKKILNKIDSFLGQSSTANSNMEDDSGANNEAGLVSSRVSLFHNMSQNEDCSWKQWKSQSMHDINHRGEKVLQRGFSRNSFDIEIITIDSQDSIDKCGLSQSHNFQNEDFVFVEKPQNDSIDNSLKDKRARLLNKFYNKSVEEVLSHHCDSNDKKRLDTQHSVRKTVQDMNKLSNENLPKLKLNVLRKTSFSKSEMDIFNKNIPNDDLDKYKSCDELPKINVRNVISLYETVSKSSIDNYPKKISKTNSFGLQEKEQSGLHYSGHGNNNTLNNSNSMKLPEVSPLKSEGKPKPPLRKLHSESQIFKSIDEEQKETENTKNVDDEKESTYISLSDIEIEIIENKTEVTVEKIPKEAVAITDDYKFRFKEAKEYFKSLEGTKEEAKLTDFNECEKLLYNLTESPEKRVRQKKRIKRNKKSKSMDSTEISRDWKQLHGNHTDGSDETDTESKPATISGKFHIDDLFTDVTEGKLSRQGSLRGIPRKKAVLETFKSMENVHNSNVSPYEIAVSQLKDFAKENDIKNAQTYLSEYPYLPKTDPSKYHSRIDVKASGLISMKELLNDKPRRNSVPDLRINTKFVVDL